MESSEYSVIVSSKAANQLRNHAVFLASVSPNAARKLVKEFQSAVATLKMFPNRCAWLEGEYLPVHTYRKLLFSKNHILIFKIEGNIVLVEYVLDCRQNYSWLK